MGTVYPVFDIVFKVNTAGRTSPGTLVPIADMETFGIAFDNGIEEWTPMDTKGWTRRLMTAKSVTISLNGKRQYGDPGNDYVAGLAHKTGNDANSIIEINFPDGAVFNMPCVVNVTASDGGDSTNVAALEFEAMSDGAPTYTPASEGGG